MAVGHEVDVPGGPASPEHPLKGAFLRVGNGVEPPGVGLHTHDPGVPPCVADNAGDIGVTQGPVLLQNSETVRIGGPSHRGEGTTDRHSGVVSRHRDGAHHVVINLGGEAGHPMRLQIHSAGAQTRRGVELGEGAREVQGRAVGGELQVHDRPVGRRPQRFALASGVHRRHPIDRLIIDGGEVATEVDGGAVSRGRDRADLAVDLGRPVKQRAGRDVVGHGVVARGLVLAIGRAEGAGIVELSDDVDDIAHDRLVPDDAVDLGGGQNLRGGESDLPLGSSSRGRDNSWGDERTKGKGEGGQNRPHTGDSAERMHECSVLKT